MSIQRVEPDQDEIAVIAPQVAPWLAWLSDFEAKHARPLRVIHIGNIANNAYNNAKIQRRFGIHADVVCYDYYHIMGCPEWEDADFTGDPGDPFFPDWWNVDLRGFVRPLWFAQGRLPTTQRYLLARITGRRLAAPLLWQRLRFDQWIRCRSSRAAYIVTALLGLTAPQSTLGQGSRAASGVPGVVMWLRGVMRAGRHATARGLAFVRARLTWFIVLATRKIEAAGRALALMGRGGSWRTAVLTVFPRRLASVARTPDQEGLVLIAELTAAGWNNAAAREAVSSIVAASRVNPAIAHELANAGSDRRAGPLKVRLEQALAQASAPVDLEEKISRIADEARDHPLTPKFRSYFPGREPPFRASDVAGYEPALAAWAKLLRHYDIVQGYSSDPIIPLLCGVHHFTAYEHGTLRQIPFEDSSRGRICALSYRAAPVVFVTNSDVVPSVHRLGLADDRVVFLPNAVDSQKLFDYAEANEALVPAPGSDVSFFSPSRHDWLTPDPNFNKLNDRLIEALALVRDDGLSWHATFVGWGKDVEASKALISRLQLDDRITWIEPLKKRELWARYLASHAVVDQFMAPAIGGVAFEAMALGRRVITALDVAGTTSFFGAEPPLLAAWTVDEIAAALRRVTLDPADEAGIGQAAQEWFRRWHSAERIVQLQVDAYRRIVSSEARPVEPRRGY